MPALLRHARNTDGAAMRRALAEAGYDDIPGNGALRHWRAGDGRRRGGAGALIRELQVSKQAAGQMVDTRCCAAISPARPARPTAASSPSAGPNAVRPPPLFKPRRARQIDSALALRVCKEDIRNARRVLAALIDIGQESETPDDGH